MGDQCVKRTGRIRGRLKQVSLRGIIRIDRRATDARKRIANRPGIVDRSHDDENEERLTESPRGDEDLTRPLKHATAASIRHLMPPAETPRLPRGHGDLDSRAQTSSRAISAWHRRLDAARFRYPSKTQAHDPGRFPPILYPARSLRSRHRT